MSYKDLVLADSPVAFWKLDELTGTVAADSSGNALAGTYTGGYTLGSAPPPNVPGAVQLDGSTGWVDCGAPAALNLTAAWTLEIWCYLLATPSGVALISEQFTTGGLNVLYTLAFSNSKGGANSTLMTGFYNGSSWSAIVGPTLTNNSWHHTVSTWDGTTLKLYIDGALAVSGNPGVAPVAGMNRLYLGRRWDTKTSPYSFNGKIAAAAIYGTALSAERVLAHYNAGK